MLSKKIAIPFALALIILLILAIQNPNLGIYLVIPVLALATIYVFHPQIDWWWYQKHPPQMDAKGQELLERFSAFYQSLNTEEKTRFRNRTMMIRTAKEFISQAEDKSVPEDARLIFAASQAQVTFGLDDYLILDFEKVVIYPGAFPSPKYPKLFHVSETFEEDTKNGYIFSLEHAMLGFTQPQQYYPTMLHEVCQSLIQTQPDRPWPLASDESWPVLEQISDFSTATLKEFVNRPDLEPLATMLTYFLSFPKPFQAQQPQLFAACAEALNQNPLDH